MGKSVYFILCSVLAAVAAFAAAAIPLDDADRLYFEKGPSAAFDIYEKAFYSGKSERAALNALVAGREAGEIKRAAKLAAKAVKAHPAAIEVRRLAASVLASAEEYGDAEALLGEEPSVSSMTASDFITLAVARLGREKYASAVDAAKEALEIEPDSSVAYFLMGRACELDGKSDDAIRSYEAVLACDSQFIEARKRLAAVLARKGKIDEAWKQYTKVSYAEPKDKNVKAQLEQLAPLLTKKPSEIMPPSRIPKPHPVKSAANASGLPLLRIGLAATAGGAPTQKNKIEFTPSANFLIIDAKTGKRITGGRAGETWSVELDTRSMRAGILRPGGARAGAFSGAVTIKSRVPGTGTIIIKSLLLGHGTAWGNVSDKEVRGVLEISVNRDFNTLSVVNVVNIEEYLYGVVPSEMPYRYPPEALKAQAVLARTYAVYNKGRHSRYGYDLCDGQHCQAYSGVVSEKDPANAAVDATRGQILSYKGKPVSTVFFSNCGGFTQPGSGAGWADNPYWTATSDYHNGAPPPSSPYGFYKLVHERPPAYCSLFQYSGGVQFRWQRYADAKDIALEVFQDRDIGAITALVPLRGASGYVNSIAIQGTRGTLVSPKEHQIRQYLASGMLRSAAFSVEPFYKDGKPVFFIFSGSGWGHGVGLCQAGAAGRADAGMNYKEILLHYYPGTRLDSIGGPRKKNR